MRTLPVLLTAVALAFPFAASAEESYTTLDALWGDDYGTFNDTAIPLLLDELIAPTDPLAIGVPGRSVSFEDGSEQCILDGLPAVGRIIPLPGGIGDATVGADCVLPTSFPANRRGRFKNRLIGEVVKLSLNVRLDPDLEDLVLVPTIKAIDALPGTDGLYGTEDDEICADCDTLTFDIPERLMTALDSYMPVAPTVGGLLGFANSTLGDGETYGARQRDVWQGVAEINRAFEGGRFYANAPEDSVIIPIIFFKEGAGEEEDSVSGSRIQFAARNTPGHAPTFHVTLPEPSMVRIDAFAISGRRVAALVDRLFPAGENVIDFDYARVLPSGVYFVRAVSTGVGSGEIAVRTTKAVVVR
jgi:hypothetical protein